MAQLNDLLVLGKATIKGSIQAKSDHDFLCHGNEFTFASPGYSGDIYINYRTASGAQDGAIANYRFCNGSGGSLANVYGSTFYGNLSGNATSATSANSATSATYASYLTTSISFTPADSALTPENVRALIGDGSRIRRGSWSYASNGHIVKGDTTQSQCPFGAIDLAGTTVIQANNGSSAYTQVYITPTTSSGVSGAITGEMIYYIDNGSGYSPGWRRVLTNANYSSYALPLSGGTMTGLISYKTTNYTSTPLSIYDDGNSYGHTLVLGAGSTVYLGAGESASAMKTAIASTSENLYLSADTQIEMYTNCDTIANRKKAITLDTNGLLTAHYGTFSYGVRTANRGYGYDTGSYGNSALEIREYNFGGAQSDTWGYAPRLSFHWGGRVAAQIGLASNGMLYINNNAASSTAFNRIVVEDGGTYSINISGNAATASSASSASTANAVANTGYGDGTFTWYQSSGAFAGREGWASYLISNHGNGSNYYHQIIAMPFWSAPCYRRMTGSTSNVTGWYEFITDENYTSKLDGRYVNTDGDTMTGPLKVNSTIFGYNYTNTNNAAAFIWDKPNSYYTGVGACGVNDTIYFGACDANGAWQNYKQKWIFNGTVDANSHIHANGGYLYSTANGNTITIGSQNSTWCHIYNSNTSPFIFNEKVFTFKAFCIYEMGSEGVGTSFPSSPHKGQIFFKLI